MYKSFFKPILDFIAGIVGVVLLSPVFLILVIAIKIDSKGPVFFTQQRVGKNKKLFKILKFRTMRTDTPKDCPTHLLKDPAMYITKVGKFLRKTSLDELPQLFNLLAMQMSVVGPRPALWNQYDLIEERDKYGVNNLTPGITGLAQISGRDELEIPIKAQFDGEYVKRMGFFFDIKCVLLTAVKVVKSDGVKEGGTGNK